MARPLRIVVVGAGASGMTAAACAAAAGAQVTLLEAGLRPGRSILESGNGRCNFCNADLAPRHYSDPDFAACLMGDTPLDDILAFFSDLGLTWHIDEQGRYFPLSKASSSVLNVLLRRLKDLDVNIRCSCKVSSFEKQDVFWCVHTDTEEDFECDELIWCAGAADLEVLPSALMRRNTTPVLCPLEVKPHPVQDLDGVRCEAEVSVFRGATTAGDPIWRDCGEVLFRRYGLSGIVIFDASRYASSQDTLLLDCLVSMDEATCAAWIRARLDAYKRSFDTARDCLDLLDGCLHPKLGRFFMRTHCGKSARSLVRPEILAHEIKNMQFRVAAPANTDFAQAHRGGVAVSEIDPLTCETRKFAGLYICGEALDVDGACGGFNLSWAWKSGMVAGQSAAAHRRVARAQRLSCRKVQS